ncbi:hypothetical protein [Riemerella columbipharyngis]|uniref:Uncharacterized protein n=1 Tax=Riemerella columbipharyngis TaxID=1071918 RepID=A0A1G7FBE8_9FLAO|nr:hypothetical protein [Riemerella columbipharyngis]SDE73278.1 hypothetical protein SAMN05421544_12125 [Riemerella columbipharyngis]
MKKTIKKLVHRVLKYRHSAVSFIFADMVVAEEWILFGRFTISKTFKTLK